MPERKREDREGTEELCSVTVGIDKKHLAFILLFFLSLLWPSGGSFINVCFRSSPSCLESILFDVHDCC